jgi:AhpD family alkylhydroperoxidase
MTRIQGVRDGQGNPFVRFAFRETRKRVGRVVAPMRVLARRPLLMAGNGAMEIAFDRSHVVDEHLKELATLKAAALVGCPFCLDIGSMMARRSGTSEEQLRALGDYADSPAFDARETVVLDLAVAMTATPVALSDELWARLRERFDEPALVELVAMIGWENFRARTNHAWGLGSEGFCADGACALPERLPASMGAS